MSKDQLWDQVKDTLSGLDIRQVVGSLVHMSREGVHTLREHTLKINISQDAKKLRFKYEKGGILRDISTPPTKLQSVQQLLEECQMKHVMRFVETEKHRNEAHTHIQALEAMRTKIIAALKRYFSSIHQGNLGLAMSLVQAKLDLTADTTAKECYRQEAESLKEKRAKQDLIQIVARQNGGAQTRLAAHKRDLTQYIMRSLLDHELETLTVTATLKDSVTAEVEKFVSLALPYLAFIYLDR
nr:hypothetical protein BaRGS_022143 [Batillaria attramentaria]